MKQGSLFKSYWVPATTWHQFITYFVNVPISCGNVANRFEYKYSSVREDATSLTDDGSVLILDFDRSSLVRPSSLHLLNSRGRS